MIVTLAGHVDHGKTSLVKALTGIETDVLREERQRGLTIDLGFAYLDDDGTPLGFVDVPGHHRFIHNMVAGVASRQFALLAVAADDGPMPQSREHLQILNLIGLSQGVVALTKCDRASPERIQAAEQEVRALTAGTFLEKADIHRTSARDGLGIDHLRQALRMAHRNERRTALEREFRLAVDRAFSLRGTGLVATGTVHDGQAFRNGELFVFPGGDKARVRGLRVQGRDSDQAAAGDRAALNLAGIELPRIRRGCWLTETPCPERRSFAIELQVLADFPRPVKHWLPVHVYQATAHATARLALLQPGALPPGQRADAELICDQPLCARHGDRLVLRDQSLERTLGGGRVLTDTPPVQPLRAQGHRPRRSATASAGRLEAIPHTQNRQPQNAAVPSGQPRATQSKATSFASDRNVDLRPNGQPPATQAKARAQGHRTQNAAASGNRSGDRPAAARRRHPQRLARIAAFRGDDPKQILRALLNLGPLEIAPVRGILGLTEARFGELLVSLNAKRRGDAAIDPALWARWRRDALACIAALQRERPDAPGAIPSQLPAAIPAAFRSELLNELAAENQLARTAGAYHLPSHIAALSTEEQALLKQVHSLLDADQSPSAGDLAKALGLPLATLEAQLKRLAKRGALVQVSAKRFYLPERLASLARCAAALAAQAPFSARQFRDAAGIGRNAAIEVLEYFDGKGFTRRTGDARSVAGEPPMR